MRNLTSFFLIVLLYVIGNISILSSKKNKKLLKITKRLEENQLAKDYFSGIWIADGYSCSSDKEEEIVEIKHEKNELIARKLIGDDCVNKNQITFRALIQDSWKKDNEYSCSAVIGTKQSPQSQTTDNCTIKIIDENNFILAKHNISFKRSKAYHNEYFKGEWISDDYACSNTKTREDISITYTSTEFIAIKIHGDDCVNSGAVTFSGKLEERWFSNEIPCSITLGTVNNPESHKNKCTITILGDDTFQINEYDLNFKRVNKFLKNYFFGTWIGEGYKCDEKTYSEKVNITLEEGMVVAKKIDGDDCVSKGNVSFKLIAQSQYKKENLSDVKLPCTIFTGTIKDPNFEYKECTLALINHNSFKIEEYGITFTRK